MKFGVMLSSCKAPQIFTGGEAAGNARAYFATARGALLDGESASLYAVPEDGAGLEGAPVTLERVYQPGMVSPAELFN